LTSAALPGKLDPNDERPIEKQMFGYCWQNYDRRVSWRTLVAELRPAVQELFQKVEPQGVRLPSGAVAAKQTVVAWSLPAEPAQDRRGSRFGVVAVEHGGDGVRVVEVPADSPGARLTVVATGAVLRLEPGDVIVEINGRAIRSGAEYVEAVKGSPQTMELVVRDVKDGSRLKLRTRLRY
jgi:S1-C subfamily serine protease